MPSWFPVGNVLLVIIAVLAYFGLMHGALDRMRLTDRAAVIGILVILVGGFYNVTLWRGRNELVINIGGAIVPLAIAIYLIVTADTVTERVRGSVAGVVTGVAVYLIGKIIPANEPGVGFIDPMYIHAIVAGAVGYLSGRSRRASFIGGVIGTVLADLGHFVEVSVRGLRSPTVLGGGGAFDATVIAAVLAVALAELVGETREYIGGGHKEPVRLRETPPDRDSEHEHAERGSDEKR